MKMPFSNCQGCKRRRERLLRWLGLEEAQKPQEPAQEPQDGAQEAQANG